MSKSILVRTIGDQDRCKNVRDVIPCFLGQILIRRPEIHYARASDGTVDVTFAGVIRGHRKLPVAVIAIGKEFQITSGSSRRFVKTVSLVNIRCAQQTKPCARSWDELPEPGGRRPRKSRRFPCALDLAEPGH